MRVFVFRSHWQICFTQEQGDPFKPVQEKEPKASDYNQIRGEVRKLYRHNFLHLQQLRALGKTNSVLAACLSFICLFYTAFLVACQTLVDTRSQKPVKCLWSNVSKSVRRARQTRKTTVCGSRNLGVTKKYDDCEILLRHTCWRIIYCRESLYLHLLQYHEGQERLKSLKLLLFCDSHHMI